MGNTINKQANRLIKEKSPYLLQHVYNPVEWYPWSEEAFIKARMEDKPIFLSIGYSTCHWCHVFERESFEDEEVAAILNEHFVSIKVDREERPDIDTIYMQACQAMTGQGGWPLSIFMTPDKKPFYAGTYFPKNSQRGMPGFIDILRTISQIWSTRREDLEKISQETAQAISEAARHKAGQQPDRTILDHAYRTFQSMFDPKYGGFGSAPKFPTPHNLLFLLRYWNLTGEQQALSMVEKTLTAMYQGGIYDHIGFGFCRYSTDRKWLVPHFEKMLYDNALLAWAYGEAYQATKNPLYARVVREIYTYILRDMTSPEGAFYAAEDADSEGVEGKFYVWTPEEVEEIFGRELGQEFCRTYDIVPQGNFEGKSIPNLIKSGITTGLETSRQRLFEAREKRVHPFKDDKILTSWNGLMIAGLAINGRILDEPIYTDKAVQAMEFILRHLRRDDGRLLARYRHGEAKELGIVDDYAFTVLGLIELFLTTAQKKYLTLALELNEDLLRLFWDEKYGGLFHYGQDAEQHFARPKELYDGAIPSGNSVAAYNFVRLARLTQNRQLQETARRQLESFGGTIKEAPSYYSFFLLSVLMEEAPPLDLQIITPGGDAGKGEMLSFIRSYYAPSMLTVCLTEKEAKELGSLVPSLTGRHPVHGKTTAYLCRNYTCHSPVTSQEELKNLLEKQD